MFPTTKAEISKADSGLNVLRIVLVTLLLLAIYRIGWQIPLPIFDQAQVWEFAKKSLLTLID